MFDKMRRKCVKMHHMMHQKVTKKDKNHVESIYAKKYMIHP